MAYAQRILIIEDDAGVALALYRGLSSLYRVIIAKTASSGIKKAINTDYDAIILDLGLPDMSGLEVCRRLRGEEVVSPVIILTAQTSVNTKVSLLDAGASDYVTKPFSLEELKARLRVATRRTRSGGVGRMAVGDLTMDTQLRQVERAGQLIPLRRKEYDILECLLQHSGNVVTRNILIDYAWEGRGDAWTNTVDVHINHLRDKIDKPFTAPLIKTVHGLGYKLDASKS